MKTGIIEMDAFREVKALSYSRLSNLVVSPQSYKAGLEDKESSGFALGSAVDLLLTDPEAFEREFYVMSADKPGSEMMLKFCEVYAESGDVEAAHIASGFKISRDATLAKFDKDGGVEYFTALVKSQGKKIIGVEEMFKANTLVNMIKENEFTKRYFPTIDDPDIEIRYQIPIVWKFKHISLLTNNVAVSYAKSVLDSVHIDHRNKIITPIELKTGAEPFMKSYWKYKRYLQGTMYYDAVKSEMSIINEEEYKILPTKFIFADTNMFYPPRIYSMTDFDLQISREGLPHYDPVLRDYWNTNKVKGYKQLAAELEWHEKTDKWDYSYDVYQNNGETDINAFAIKL